MRPKFILLICALFICTYTISAVASISDTLSTVSSEVSVQNVSMYENGNLNFTYKEKPVRIPAWTSILPPLLAILMALLFKEVISSLLIGILSGVCLLEYAIGNNILTAFFTLLDTYIIQSINDESHIYVIVFSLMIGAMVAVISRNGGMQGIVNKLTPYAKNPLYGQLITWFLGVIIFFDDYANTLVVGNTMRPVTDRLKISREKLAYIVDSTAAPVAAIAFVTTWIGAELGFIGQAIELVNSDPNTIDLNETPYSVFINSLQFSFYPILTLLFILMLVLSGRDFGPMLKAEKRARKGEVLSTNNESGAGEIDNALLALNPKEGISPKWYNALLPVLALIVTVIGALIYTGYDASVWNDESLSFTSKISATIGNSDSYKALLWGSGLGLFTAILLSLVQRIMKVTYAFETVIDGFKTMMPAISILILAWALGKLTSDMHTAEFLSLLLSDKINPYYIAEITFVISALTAFSTGTSWGTMTILYPLALPLTWNICNQAGLDPEETHRIFYNVVSVVLAGAVFGDHCSPISDTTILSSMASSCPHIDHVKTQLPYAVIVAVISMLVCTKMADYGLPWYITYTTGIALLYGVIRLFGKKSEIAHE
ncbi:MAG TPA: Na+/H+ antiporter NhaC family protein [Bacteroidia bacterium]|nr:Na+/H+ antiporter NhaC family protein [Bacteroidia bacterium]HNT80998.1 Na+/H+ antiporter NhaC family protein [Bacteroidia bacterium]